MKTHITYFVLFLAIVPAIASAHPGRTDASGCHTCKKNCAQWGLSYGEYHCHQSKGLPQPIAPIHSVRNTTGVGSTVSAPEYAVQKKPIIKNEVPVPTTSTATVTAEKRVLNTGAVKSPIVVKKKSLLSRLFGW